MNYEFDSTDKSPEIDLFSFEKLDRNSPELWPQLVPGLSEFMSSIKTPAKSTYAQSSNAGATANSHETSTTNLNPPKWMSDLNKEDIELLNDLATLSTEQLMAKVKDLMEVAYQLGMEESNQMTRGRLLSILDSRTDN